MNRRYAIILLIITLCMILSFLFNFHHNERIISSDPLRVHASSYDKRELDIRLDGANKILEEALIGNYSFNELPLTKNFISKFPRRNKIISDLDNVSDIFSYVSMDNDNNKGKICIYASKGFDLINKYGLDYATIYVFDYKVINNKLDDVVLFDKYDVSEMTGKKIS